MSFIKINDEQHIRLERVAAFIEESATGAGEFRRWAHLRGGGGPIRIASLPRLSDLPTDEWAHGRTIDDVSANAFVRLSEVVIATDLVTPHGRLLKLFVSASSSPAGIVGGAERERVCALLGIQ